MSAALRQTGERPLQGPPPFAGTPKYLPPEYNPRHDPTYVDRVLCDLFAHWGQWRRLQATVGGDFETVRDAVQVGRNLGFVIEGDHGLGYRVVDFHRVRYLRVAQAAEWPPEPDPNQLTLDDSADGCFAGPARERAEYPGTMTEEAR